MTLSEIFNKVQFNEVWQVMISRFNESESAYHSYKHSFLVYQNTMTGEDDGDSVSFVVDNNSDIGYEVQTTKGFIKTIMARQMDLSSCNQSISEELCAAIFLACPKDFLELDAMTHIRLRPGIYIGKRNNGDGSSVDNGIYNMVRYVVEYFIERSKTEPCENITINVYPKKVAVTADNIEISIERMEELVSNEIKSSGDLDEITFKTLNALSKRFIIKSYTNDTVRIIETSLGDVLSKEEIQRDQPSRYSDNSNYTILEIIPDESQFENYEFKAETILAILKDYSYCNPDIKFSVLTGSGCEKFFNPDGMLNLVEDMHGNAPVAGAIHVKTDMIDFAIARAPKVGGGVMKSFVNGLPTIQHGSHVAALTSGIYFLFNRNFHIWNLSQNILDSLIIAINIQIEEPQFESCVKTKLASIDMSLKTKESIESYIERTIIPVLKKYLWKHNDIYRDLVYDIREPGWRKRLMEARDSLVNRKEVKSEDDSTVENSLTSV